MAKRDAISAERARQLLDYNPETGRLLWKSRPVWMFKDDAHRSAESRCLIWNTRWAGKEPGRTNEKGYVIIGVEWKEYRAHRLIWLMMTGMWPKDEVDHRDGDGGNNRWGNLREADRFENHQNMKKSKANKSGITGVSWSTIMNKWFACINVNRVRHSLGYFDDLIEAAMVRAQAKKHLHKFNPVQRV